MFAYQSSFYVADKGANAVVSMLRDTTTGQLSAPISVTHPDLIDPQTIVVSPDGLNLYITSFYIGNGQAVVIFNRDSTGRLSNGRSVVNNGNTINMYWVYGVAISPDGLHVYLVFCVRFFFFSHFHADGNSNKYNCRIFALKQRRPNCDSDVCKQCVQLSNMA